MTNTSSPTKKFEKEKVPQLLISTTTKKKIKLKVSVL